MEKGSLQVSAQAVVKSVQNFVKLSEEEIEDVLVGMSIPYNYEKSRF